MKKSLLAVLLLLFCAFSLCACQAEEVPEVKPPVCTVTYIWQSPASPLGPKTYTTEVVRGSCLHSVHDGENEEYFIEGWYREDGRKWDFGDPVLEDMTLEANFIKRTYTVTYMALGVERAESERQYGAKAIDVYVERPELVSAFPAWEEKIASGYRFAGWTLNGELWDFENDVVTGHIVLEALFLPVEEQ